MVEGEEEGSKIMEDPGDRDFMRSKKIEENMTEEISLVLENG